MDVCGDRRVIKTGYVYIMANASRTIYVGVTSDLERRAWEHKTHFRDGFTKQQHATKLVYIAEFARMDDAIAWGKAVKGKTRAKKIVLIEERNPRWNDLSWNWFDRNVAVALAPLGTFMTARRPFSHLKAVERRIIAGG